MSAITIYDPLYGPIAFPEWVKPVLLTPEMQRLREVGLFNSKTWALTGTGGVSRFEHSVGAGYLALLCNQARGVHPDSIEARATIAGALLHDVATGPFGHTVERVLSRLGFSHSHVLNALQGKYHAVAEEPFFAGSPARLATTIATEILQPAMDSVLGLPPVGPLISSDLDLDNIDNVTRGAMYLGLGKESALAVALAQCQQLEGDEITLQSSDVHLVLDWRDLRTRLYDLLFESPAQVAAEAMIFDATLRLVHSGELELADWRLTDHELLQRFDQADDPTVQQIGRQLRLGRTFNTAYQFLVDDVAKSDLPADGEFLEVTDQWKSDFYGCDIVFLKHDHGQTRRAVTRKILPSGTTKVFGSNSRRATVTVLARRKDLDCDRLLSQREALRRALEICLTSEVSVLKTEVTGSGASALSLW